jgi:L-seryl-tRNA(Ser) seleniumtransferase
MAKDTDNALLRALPPVDALLHTATARDLRARLGEAKLTELARAVTDELRAELRGGLLKTDAPDVRSALLAEAGKRLAARGAKAVARGLRRVINATGVIIHTNLGRAPLAPEAIAAMNEAARYCALEYDLETGRRGPRGGRVDELLAELTGAEAACVVNNCAAAALLVLTALAQGGETIVSRGELVEIGGDFRVPDVMAQSGTRMVEVGTTNRTKLRDYEQAITSDTRLLMRVHPSNFRVVGFTAMPALRDMAALARERGLILYEDAGSGALLDLRPLGLEGEPVIAESLAAGADVVTFSGDKLLGGVQAGCIAGRRELVEKIRKHPLFRALRADKLRLAALEATLESYRRGLAHREIPVLQTMSLTAGELQSRARKFRSRLREHPTLDCEVVNGQSAIGGGSAPLTQPPTALIAITHKTLSATEIESALRSHTPPVIARIAGDCVLLDLRTISAGEEQELIEALRYLP